MSLQLAVTMAQGAFRLRVDLAVAASGVTALYGPSGCGKTSLLRTIAGLDRFSDGEVKFGDQVWQNRSVFVPAHQRRIGYVFQDAHLFPHLNVHDNLRFASRRLTSNEVTISEQQAIDMLDLEALLGREVSDLSGGEQQRVAMARALCSSPRLLLMDEPVSALDRDSKATILPYIESLTRALDLPVIYVSHSLNEVAMIADHLVMMSRQGIVGSGDIQSMLTRLDMPLAREDDAESMITARVSGYDSQYGLTYLDSDMGRFTVVSRSLPEGERVRLRVAARDVSLTLTPQTDTSILNIFPATIVEVSPYDASQLIVKLSAGGVPVLARVTRKSAASLEVTPGKAVYIQVKSIAVF